MTKDYDKAVEWYRKAAEQGHNWAQNNLGNCYYNGKGVPQDYAKAVDWYRKAAEQGLANAQNNLGNCYRFGEGVTKDYAKAVEWYRKAAEQGLANAQNNLGDCYYSGKSVTQDYAKAFQWYNKAAEQENDEASAYICVMYYTGQGVAKNVAKANEWYNKALKNGAKESWVIYKIGSGFYDQKDYSKAMEWFLKGEVFKDTWGASCSYWIAVMYRDGKGVPQNLTKAKLYAQKAVDKEDSSSNRKLLDNITYSIQQDKEDDDYINTLVKKYGKSSVDALNKNTLCVGMPIAMLLEMPHIKVYKMYVYNGAESGQFKVEIMYKGTAYSGMAAAPSAGIFFKTYRIWVSNSKITQFKEWTNADEREFQRIISR